MPVRTTIHRSEDAQVIHSLHTFAMLAQAIVVFHLFASWPKCPANGTGCDSGFCRNKLRITCPLRHKNRSRKVPLKLPSFFLKIPAWQSSFLQHSALSFYSFQSVCSSPYKTLRKSGPKSRGYLKKVEIVFFSLFL